ncbi:MAG: hypothetical protein AAF862_08780 [Pseudomonadota bacterium]
MTPETFARVRHKLRVAPSTFLYSKGDYAFQLLHRQVGAGASARVLKSSGYRALLHQPRVQGALSGSGILDQGDCERAQHKGKEHAFPVSWRAWGRARKPAWQRRHHQMARPGLNLVLQLNLPHAHLRDFRALCGPKHRDPFNHVHHPARRSGDVTLAWARLDLDLGTREALIEELQSDWINNAKDDYAWGCIDDLNYQAPEHRRDLYFKYVLKEMQQLWAEALLSAALYMLCEILRLRHIYIYDYATGCGFKTGSVKHPVGPVSLYEKLPKAFCMEKREIVPDFLAEAFEDEDVLKAFYAHTPRFWSLQSRGSVIAPAARKAA